MILPNDFGREFVAEKSTAVFVFWTCPHVLVGKKYGMDDGAVEIDSIQTIGFPDITIAPKPSRCGFLRYL